MFICTMLVFVVVCASVTISRMWCKARVWVEILLLCCVVPHGVLIIVHLVICVIFPVNCSMRWLFTSRAGHMHTHTYGKAYSCHEFSVKLCICSRALYIWTALSVVYSGSYRTAHPLKRGFEISNRTSRIKHLGKKPV